MRKPRIAILGATGVVGREITKITEELDFFQVQEVLVQKLHLRAKNTQ